MQRSIKLIAVASMLGVLAASATAFADPAAWRLSATLGVNPNPAVAYQHQHTNNGVTKRADWWVGWAFGAATASYATTANTPHQAAMVKCQRAGWPDITVNQQGATYPGTTPGWSSYGQTNWALCPTNYIAKTGFIGIYS